MNTTFLTQLDETIKTNMANLETLAEYSTDNAFCASDFENEGMHTDDLFQIIGEKKYYETKGKTFHNHPRPTFKPLKNKTRRMTIYFQLPPFSITMSAMMKSSSTFI